MHAVPIPCPAPASDRIARSSGGPVQTDEVLAAYYARRAPEMDEAYQIPPRQEDLRHLRARLSEAVAGRDLLEVACGTGYWTQVMSTTARSITATDVNETMIELARRKRYGPAPVTFMRADAWQLEGIQSRFNAAAALFWWSHMPRARIPGFLDQLDRVLEPGALVVLADHRPGDSRFLPPSRLDEQGNTYQRRRLRTGEEFEIIKNYPDEAELRLGLLRWADNIAYEAWTSLWVITGHTRSRAST